MINIFSLSLYLPNLYQAMAILLTAVNLFIIFFVLDKHNMANKLFCFILVYFVLEIAFCFIWRLIVGIEINDINELLEIVKSKDNMYDVIVFSILFFIIIAAKYRSLLLLRNK